VKNVPPLGNYQLAVLAAWQQIRAWIKELVQVDAVTIGSHAHCFKLPWINLVLLEILQSAYQLIPRSPTCLVDDILDLGWYFSVIQHDERPPLAMVNKVGNTAYFFEFSMFSRISKWWFKHDLGVQLIQNERAQC